MVMVRNKVIFFSEELAKPYATSKPPLPGTEPNLAAFALKTVGQFLATKPGFGPNPELHVRYMNTPLNHVNDIPMLLNLFLYMW